MWVQSEMIAERETPQPIKHRTPWHERMSHHPGIHEAIRAFLGFNRDVPGEILDDELIETIFKLGQGLESWKEAGRLIRESTSLEDRARARAVLMNLSRLKREHGGRYPWEI